MASSLSALPSCPRLFRPEDQTPAVVVERVRARAVSLFAVVEKNLVVRVGPLLDDVADDDSEAAVG